MRVRVRKSTRTYWNYTVIDVAAGTEHDGEFARHLHDSGVNVEILKPDPEPPTVPEQKPEQDDNPPGESDDEPPLDGTIGALLAWVSDDLERARTALAAEQAKDKPRKAVVTKLTEITEPATTE
ncbi:hypothetical protein [Kitasatospora sp. NPDC004272]